MVVNASLSSEASRQAKKTAIQDGHPPHGGI
jgi:hypothetical protein